MAQRTLASVGAWVALGAALLVGCDRDRDARGEPAVAAAQTRAPVHVDSIFPIEEELRRFRAGLPETKVLGPGAATSRDALVSAFVAALAANDTAVFAAMALDRAEFAYLYYPHTMHTRPPYELSPALVWFQIQQNSEKGLGRVLRRLGGSQLRLLHYRCDPQPESQEQNLIWSGCALRLQAGAEHQRLFGSILERDGRFKFVSYANNY